MIEGAYPRLAAVSTFGVAAVFIEGGGQQRWVAIAFPGDNSWARMHRPVEKSRRAHPTHRGIDECRTFADRFIREGIQFEIEHILVNGGPWHSRVALRGNDFIPGPDGDEYSNRFVALLELRWGKLVLWEDYEDTERVSALDRAREGRDVSRR